MSSSYLTSAFQSIGKLFVKGSRKGKCADKKQLNTIFTTVTLVIAIRNRDATFRNLVFKYKFPAISGEKIIVGARVSTQLQWS